MCALITSPGCFSTNIWIAWSTRATTTFWIPRPEDGTGSRTWPRSTLRFAPTYVDGCRWNASYSNKSNACVTQHVQRYKFSCTIRGHIYIIIYIMYVHVFMGVFGFKWLLFCRYSVCGVNSVATFPRLPPPVPPFVPSHIHADMDLCYFRACTL